MTVFQILFVFIALLGAFSLAWQVFHLIELDAACRGLKHPKFWGLLSIGGNSGSGGLLLYLLGRRRYPRSMTEPQAGEMARRKRRAGVSCCFIGAGAIGLIATAILVNGGF